MLPILIQCAKHTPDYLLIQWSILYLEQKHLTFHLTWYKCRSEYPGHDTCIFTHAWWISIPSEKQKIKILEWISLTAQKDVAAKVIKWEFICFIISFFFFFGSWMARQKDYSINTGFLCPGTVRFYWVITTSALLLSILVWMNHIFISSSYLFVINVSHSDFKAKIGKPNQWNKIEN